ncbi:MAG: hypothetical protein WBP85_14460 [Terracidiphilus sp.]
MRQNGAGTLTYEDARTWIEETGLCLFLPRKQYAAFVAPSFVEAVAAERNPAPGGKAISQAEELLVRLETEGVAVRLNLQGQPGEHPDFIVAAWVLPYVYALRGDRDWRRVPQLTGSRAVSPLAVQAYKQLETGDATIPQLKHALSREVSESAVLRAITELWQQLRIIPIFSAPNRAPQWQLLRVRYQKAIAEGASTSQVTAISVLASIYLQAVIAATMEEVEMFLSPLTARSKVREVLRGLVATRQVHTISMGHAPHFYVAGTLPEFSSPTSLLGGLYASSSMPASSEFLRSFEHSRETSAPRLQAAAEMRKPSETAHEAADEAETKPRTAPHFSRKPARTRDRKPASSSSRNRAARANSVRKPKPAASRSLRNGHSAKASPKSSSRPAARRTVDARSRRKPALTASAKAGNRSRYGFTASSRQRTKKRG